MTPSTAKYFAEFVFYYAYVTHYRRN